MIGRLRGELLAVEGPLVTLDCNGVGYEVNVPEDLALRLPNEGERLELFVRQIVREDSLALYGFGTRAARRVFDLLLRVTGCGPKVAIAILGAVGAEEAARAVATGNPHPLTAASGVGKRLAERIVLELGSIMADEMVALAIAPGGISSVRSPKPDAELLEALAALGYKPAEAEKAAAQVPVEGDLDARIVAALRHLKR